MAEHSLTPPVSPLLLVREGGRMVSYERLELYGRLHIGGIIRVEFEDYAQISDGEFYAHFNLSKTAHHPGTRYALPKILKNGFYDATTGENQPPLLSFEDIYFGTCIDVKNGISYDDVTPAMFKHSMRHVKTVEELKWEMIERYTKSRIAMTAEDILHTPISWTLLRLELRG